MSTMTFMAGTNHSPDETMYKRERGKTVAATAHEEIDHRL